MSTKFAKIVWNVQPEPTGRYRSFERRGWPSAVYADTDQACAYIGCEDEYRPANVKTGTHGMLTLYVADYSQASAKNGAFKYRTAARRCATLNDAKRLLIVLLNANPHLMPLPKAVQEGE